MAGNTVLSGTEVVGVQMRKLLAIFFVFPGAHAFLGKRQALVLNSAVYVSGPLKLLKVFLLKGATCRDSQEPRHKFESN